MTGIGYFGDPATGTALVSMPLTPAVRAGDCVYVSGQVPLTEKGEILMAGIEGQTRLVMERIDRALGAAGARLDQIVKATVYLRDARDFTAFNAVWQSYFEPGKRPARTCVQNDMIIDIRVEIDVIAYAPAVVA